MQLKEIKNSNIILFIVVELIFSGTGHRGGFTLHECVSVAVKHKQTADDEYEDEVCADL